MRMFHITLTLCCLGTLATIAAHTDSPLICPGEFSLVQDEFCYYKSTTQNTWDDANDVCLDLNGWMVVIKSDAQNYGLIDWLEINGMTFANFFSGPYIGMRRFNLSTTDFIWSHEPDRDSTYTKWKTEIPYINNELDNCGVMTADGKWFNFKCEDDRDYVCETSLGPSSPTSAPTQLRTPHPTHRPTHSHRPTHAPVTVTTTAPTITAAVDNGGGSDGGGSDGGGSDGGGGDGDGIVGNGDSGSSDTQAIDVHIRLSYILIGVGALLLLVVLYRVRPKKLTDRSKNKSVRLDDADDTNSTHNLVEMETRKTYGEDVERHSAEEIDMGGCFAFGNSSAEEMLASQLNVKVYSSVSNDLNSA